MSLFGALIADPGFDRLVLSAAYVDYLPDELMMSNTSSSFTDLYYAPRLTYYLGKTYLAYQYVWETLALPYGQAKLVVFDESRGFDRPMTIGLIPTSADSHNVPIVIADSVNNKVYLVQEHVHDTPLRVYRSDTLLDCGSFTHAFNIGTVLSYPHAVQNADGNWAIWSRGIAEPTANYYSIHATKASSGFETWGGQVRITSRPTGQDPLLRHYPDLPFGSYRADGFVHLLINCRKDDGNLNGPVWFYRYYYLKTPDSGADFMDVFWNETETFSHKVSVDGILSDAILDANFSYHSTQNDTTTGFTPCVGLGSNGKAYRIVGNGTLTGFSFIYYNGTTKVVKAVSISDAYPAATGGAGGSGSTGAFDYMMVYNDSRIEVVVYRLIGGLVRPYLFRTTNQGDTWVDLGDLCPQVADRSLRVLLPNNLTEIPTDSNFPVYFTYQGGTGQRGAICKIAALGRLQAMGGDPVVGAEPPTTNGLLRYKCVSANMTRVGNSVSQLNDIFGIRNAPTNASPQWNGSDQVTFLSSSLQKFTPATPASLITLTAMTFFFVGKNVSGIVQYMLSFTHSTNDQSRMSLNLDATGKPQVYFDKGFSNGNMIVAARDNINDGAKHLVVMVLDGVKRTDIYIDGRLQFLDLSGGTTISDYQTIGTGPANLDSRNIVVGASQNRGTDFYADLILAEQRLYSGAMRLSDLRPAMKKLCDDHGITFLSQYRTP